MNLREQLQIALRGSNAWRSGEDDDQPLISSGRLDSSALFALSLWIEERIGRPLDPSTFSVAHDWNTPAAILEFIARARSGAMPVEAGRAVPVRQPQPPPKALADSGIEVVAFRNSHRPAVAELQKRLWSSDAALNESFFEWRYERNPVPQPPLLFLAVHSGRPVAMRGAFASRWQAGEETELRVWYQSDDLVVLPDFENHGIFAAINDQIRSELAARGHRFLLSMSALRVTRMQSIASGARSLGPMQPVGRLAPRARFLDTMRRVSKRLPVAWKLGESVAGAECADRAFARLDDATPQSSRPWRIQSRREVRPHEMASLVAALGYDGRFRQLRDADYFAWRYASPLHDYRFLYADTAAGLAGYVVLERSLSDRANQRRINIADWEADSPALSQRLLDAAIRWARCPELVSWTRTLGDARASSLARTGFRPVDAEQTARGLPSVLVWPIDNSQPDSELAAGGRSLLELDNWDLRMSDTSLA